MTVADRSRELEELKARCREDELLGVIFRADDEVGIDGVSKLFALFGDVGLDESCFQTELSAETFRACENMARYGERCHPSLVARHLECEGRDLDELARCAPVTYVAEELAREVVEAAARRSSRARFAGLTHSAVLARDLPQAVELVEGLIEAGTVGTIAGLPETYKSFLALQIAHKVAASGTVLDRFPVAMTGSVGFWWQDDSEANEVTRIQTYSTRHNLTHDLPLRWHLNEGLHLPDDISLLREEVGREAQVLVVLDSLYNFIPGLGLKDEDIGALFAQLKAEICDQTGATVLVVDHAPWPTQGNRGQHRAYGSVFKAAAMRTAIHITRERGSIYIQAHGNNIPGLPSTPAHWDADTLELKLIDTGQPSDDLADRIAVYLAANPGATTAAVESAVRGKADVIRAALQADHGFDPLPPDIFGKPSNATCWALSADAKAVLAEAKSTPT